MQSKLNRRDLSVVNFCLELSKSSRCLGKEKHLRLRKKKGTKKLNRDVSR